MIVYLAQDIPAFVMYCVYGTSRSSLLIESTDSMILALHKKNNHIGLTFRYTYRYLEHLREILRTFTARREKPKYI